MPLKAATRWLLDTFEGDLSEVLVALPGARSGRLLLDALVLEAGAGLRAPEIVTSGSLSDRLLELDGEPAGRLARTLAWSHALRSLPKAKIQRIVADPPAADDLVAWWRLAEEVRTLFGEVAAEEVQFKDVAENPTLLDDGVSREGERQRWIALAAAQESMAAQLDEAGLADPHISRQDAIDAGRAAGAKHVVMIGVVEMNRLLRSALELSSAQCTALVLAPQELADTFDTLGCLLPAEWATREVSLDLARWHVADRPGDQAQRARAEIASWEGTYSADQISIGLGNQEAGPFVKRCLGADGIVVRDAAGESLGDSTQATLLALLGRFLESESFLDYGDLLRHVDFEAAVRLKLDEIDPLVTIDAYFNKHYPDRIDGKWLANKKDKYDLALRKQMEDVWNASATVLGELWSSRGKASRESLSDLRNFTEALYAGQEFDLATDAGRRGFSALEAIGKGLAEIEALPKSFLPQCTSAQALELLERSLRSSYLPPAAAKPEDQTIEMLGWLELPLDNAPALVVVGFEDGHVPESVRGDAYLPNQLRSSLQLVNDEQRLARDIYATELLLHSRERVAFFSGRRTLVGDSLLPSRIVFHCPPDEVPTRVRRFITGDSPPAHSGGEQNARMELPGNADGFQLKTISVTDFRTYLGSPYEYYLRKVARIATLDDRARELDAMQFGNVAHETLDRFGSDLRLRDSQDADEIAKQLRGILNDLSRELFGARPLPAIRLQVEHLEHRLNAFAKQQAAHRASGWKIDQVEWNPPGGSIKFNVDGESVQLRGRIDRIDKHESSGRYAVWDYKTGSVVKRPARAHRKSDGSWCDLQLPLYCLLVADLIGDQPPEKIGYIALGKDPEQIRFDPVPDDWRLSKATAFDSFEDAIEDAHEAAQDVVRAIRRGEFITPKGFDPHAGDPIMRAIGNLDLVEEVEEEDAVEEVR